MMLITLTKKNLKPLLLFIFMSLSFSARAQTDSYEIMQQRIDSLANLGLPKSALAEVQRLDDKARKEKNSPQQIRAVIYRMNFQSFIEENSLVAIIDNLKKDIEQAEYPVKPILQSLLANIYWQYYQQNRYQFSSRSKLEKPDPDISRWDLATIISESSRLYRLSVKDSNKLQNTSVGVLHGVLAGDSATRYLRPTLYDLLMHRAFDFFLSDEANLPNPILPFSLNDTRFFGDAADFGKLKINTTDTASVAWIGLTYLQQLSNFHLQRGDREAVADITIKRLRYLRDNADSKIQPAYRFTPRFRGVVQPKLTPNYTDSLYTKGLKKIAQDFAKDPISADALKLLGDYYQSDSMRTAMYYYRRAVAVYSNSLGGLNAAEAIKTITLKTLAANFENVYSPHQSILAKLDYKNLSKVQTTVYYVSENQRQELIALNHAKTTYYQQNTKLASAISLKYLQQFKPVEDRVINLTDPGDYKDHSAEFKIDALAPGSYIVVIKEPATSDSTLIQLADIRVSQLSYSMRLTPDYFQDIRVVNRETGSPLPNVHVQLTKWYNNGGDGYAGQPVDTVTDAAGKAIFSVKDGNYSSSLVFTIPGDTLVVDREYVFGAVNRGIVLPQTHAILFTDRQIYRPGQTVYFKGILTETADEKITILTKKNVTVDLKDVNNKSQGSLNLTTNDFGTFSGSFVIPVSVLNGNMRISTPYGDQEFDVEEYKRPTFQVKVDPVKENYHLDDSVRVKGSVAAFSGYGLSYARVAVHITRTDGKRDPYQFYHPEWYNRNSTEIKNDTIKTDALGKFEIKFKAVPDPEQPTANLVYNYNISLDVTDASGETHSQTTNVAVGNQSLSINAVIPQQIFTTDSLMVPLSVSNLNGHPQLSDVKVTVYALKSPKTLFESRLWGRPDQYTMSREEFKKDFPNYAYGNEEFQRRWPRLNKVVELNLKTTTSGRLDMLDLNRLRQRAPGTYEVHIHAKAPNGDTTSVISYITLLSQSGAPQNIDNWEIPLKVTVTPGSSAEFIAGFKGAHILVEHYDGLRVLSSKWLSEYDTYQKVSVPIGVEEKHPAIQLMMVYHNRLFIKYQPITLKTPDNQLDIKFLTFRNKLQPGEKEQWKLQVSAKNNEKVAAEMVADLYDASLDAILQPDQWAGKLDKRVDYQPDYYAWTNRFTQVTSAVAIKTIYYSQAAFNRDYEHLDLFGYNYYGGYNYGYERYLNTIKTRLALAELDKKVISDYEANAKLVKNGYDISGTVVDSLTHAPLSGGAIRILNTAITTSGNSKGEFRIRVPKNAEVWFDHYGYDSKLVSTHQKETMVVQLKPGPVIYKMDTVEYRASAYKVVGNSPMNDLLKKMQGVSVGVDGSITAEGRMVSKVRINGKDVTGGDQNLPAGVIANVQMIDDYGDQASKTGIKGPGGVLNITTKPGIQIRKNFSETAFFYPQLTTDDKGQIAIEFTIPDALTRWHFRAFAHTQQLSSGYLEAEVVTQKQLSISANMPRFMRQGDTLIVSARLSNLTTALLKGKVQISLFNALNMNPVKLLTNPADAVQNFSLAGKTNKAMSFKMAIPDNIDVLTYRLTATAGNFSDGEENTTPVLPNSTLVIESMPMMVRPGQTKSFTFDKLINQHSSTLKNKTLTLEYTQNPVWDVVLALPYMMEFPYECSEQTFSRYYANSLSSSIVNRYPLIKSVFEQWKSSNSTALLSNLEKNPELKSTLLEETPWLRDAQSETEQKKRIALLFDLNNMSNELKQNLDRLQRKQLSNGAFPWFGGERGDRFITQHILAGIGQLYKMNVADEKDETLKGIANNALGYVNGQLTADDAMARKDKPTYATRMLSPFEIHAWYALSYYPNAPLNADLQQAFNNYLARASSQWQVRNVYEQGMIALALSRFKKPELTNLITASLLETAQRSDEMGMYWAKNQSGYYWYQSPVETQSLMIELFNETTGNTKMVDEMKIWLLRNKQTNNWKTTKATAAACYALLNKSEAILADTAQTEILLNNVPLQTLKPNLKNEASTGYVKTTWVNDQIKPSLGRVNLHNASAVISWGSMNWQYTEQLDNITSSSTDIKLERKYFIEKQTASGAVLTTVDALHPPKVGDVLKVVVYLSAGRDYEYIQLKDLRPAGTEPVDVLSEYKYQDGLWYYQVTKDVATNFFISYLNKGNYVFEYRLRVAQPGDFSTGISSIQCMYAPEYNAHSEGRRVRFEK